MVCSAPTGATRRGARRVIVQQYQLRDLRMSVDLIGGGEVGVYLEGETEVLCPRGVMHTRYVVAEVHLDHQLCRHDLDAVEGAIRGNEVAAAILAGQLISDLQRRVWTDPCNEVRQEA